MAFNHDTFHGTAEPAPEWYASRTCSGQGLVIEEGTGRNVAVTYDVADAPLVAEAPAMESALWRAAEIMAEVVAINGSEAAAECRAEIRAILARIGGEG